jgi:hypothetical protein
MQTAAPIDPNQMLSTEDAAALLGLKPATLSNWREDGSVDLAFSKFGRSVRYRYADVIAFADRRRCLSTLAARRLKPAAPEAPVPHPTAKRRQVRQRERDLLDFTHD